MLCLLLFCGILFDFADVIPIQNVKCGLAERFVPLTPPLIYIILRKFATLDRPPLLVSLDM